MCGGAGFITLSVFASKQFWSNAAKVGLLANCQRLIQRGAGGYFEGSFGAA